MDGLIQDVDLDVGTARVADDGAWHDRLSIDQDTHTDAVAVVPDLKNCGDLDHAVVVTHPTADCRNLCEPVNRGMLIFGSDRKRIVRTYPCEAIVGRKLERRAVAMEIAIVPTVLALSAGEIGDIVGDEYRRIRDRQREFKDRTRILLGMGGRSNDLPSVRHKTAVGGTVEISVTRFGQSLRSYASRRVVVTFQVRSVLVHAEPKTKAGPQIDERAVQSAITGFNHVGTNARA